MGEREQRGPQAVGQMRGAGLHCRDSRIVRQHQQASRGAFQLDLDHAAVSFEVIRSGLAAAALEAAAAEDAVRGG